ncbi:alpha/beta fold hydrolase [Pendulispora albinea]|uniref:Alpha/beta fold hydrolase n=1 Tax=Pendulispora albinea TaxID=2741071 RepID=A0ABZ2LWE0_9BACT
MDPVEAKVNLGDYEVTTLTYAAPKAAHRLVLAHGAGADQRHAFMVRAAKTLAAAGIEVTTFNFGYTERKRKAPDPAEVLERCFRAVVHAQAQRAPGPLFLGGKSMGGRIASQIVAGGSLEADVRGLVFLGYPLHPPGKPTQLRVAHWPKVDVPQLFVQGTRDPFGTVEELTTHLPKLGAPSTVHTVEQGDHSFAVPKKLGVPQDEIDARMFAAIASWIESTTRAQKP